MTKDGATMEDMEVISVTTGTKCVNGEHMSVNGNSLNGKRPKIFSNFYNVLGLRWFDIVHSEIIPSLGT